LLLCRRLHYSIALQHVCCSVFWIIIILHQSHPGVHNTKCRITLPKKPPILTRISGPAHTVLVVITWVFQNPVKDFVLYSKKKRKKLVQIGNFFSIGSREEKSTKNDRAFSLSIQPEEFSMGLIRMHGKDAIHFITNRCEQIYMQCPRNSLGVVEDLIAAHKHQ
jgi:hypothetical protein